MSSGTQIDPNWTGADGGQTPAPAPPATVPDATGFSAGKYLSDEEILGIDPPSPNGGSGGRDRSRETVILSEAKNLSSIDAAGNAGTRRDSSGKDRPQNDTASPETRYGVEGSAAMPAWMQTLAGDPKHGAEAQQLWQEHQAYRAAFSSPAEARALKQASESVERIDTAIFSGDSRAQSEVVAELARANPAAFRSLFAEAAKVLSGMGQVAPVIQESPTLRPAAAGEGWGTGQTHNDGIPSPGRGGVDSARNLSLSSPENRQRDSSSGPNSGPPRNDGTTYTAEANPQFDPAAYASFERTTNDVVARDVRSSITETLTRVLPEGVAEGAARRIGEDIFNEIHRALAADRALSEQVGAALRGPMAAGQGWRFGSAEQQRVASLLAGRAKQLVPGVARRVIGEWTSSVLGTARTKAARQAAAEARVDIAAPGGSLDSMPLRAMSRREVDYASMSDDEILGL